MSRTILVHDLEVDLSAKLNQSAPINLLAVLYGLVVSSTYVQN